MNKFTRDLIESLTEAVEHAEGRATRVRVHIVEVAADILNPNPEPKGKEVAPDTKP